MFFKLQPVHFIGIGGIGMSGLAEVLLGMGYRVSGSDLRSSPITEGLAAARRGRISRATSRQPGGRARPWWSVPRSAKRIPKSRRRGGCGIPVIPRGELLAELMRLKFGIAVAGSHGKTTTTSMVAAIMTHAGLDPTVVVGGRVGMMGGANARLGKSDYLVVESDESDGSFLKLAPIIAVVTNIDREHLDHYAGLEEIRRRLCRVRRQGSVLRRGDAVPGRREHAAHSARREPPHDHLRNHRAGGPARHPFRCRAHGQRVSARLSRARPGLLPSACAGRAQRFERRCRGRRGSRTGSPGRANSRRPWSNSPAWTAVFRCAARKRGVTVIDDYGHHPTEIRATLAAARACRFRRVHVLFQPHRYTRTQALLDDFARAFHQADSVFVLDIYAASEKPIEGVSSRALVERIRAFGHRDAHYAEGQNKKRWTPASPP